MQSISKSSIKRVLIIINLILLVALILMFTNLNSTLSVSTIHKEITKTFGKDYEVDIFNIYGGILVVSASIPEDLYLEIDYTDRGGIT